MIEFKFEIRLDDPDNANAIRVVIDKYLLLSNHGLGDSETVHAFTFRKHAKDAWIMTCHDPPCVQDVVRVRYGIEHVVRSSNPQWYVESVLVSAHNSTPAT